MALKAHTFYQSLVLLFLFSAASPPLYSNQLEQTFIILSPAVVNAGCYGIGTIVRDTALSFCGS
jgi:hypothetical protein